MPTATKNNEVNVALTQAAEASQGIALVQQAQGIVIRNKEQHEQAREFQKGAKALRKAVMAHYAEIKTPLNGALTKVRDMEKRDLAPIDQAIDMAERIDTAYVREQQRIESEAAETARLEAEAKESERRQREADEAEAAAEKLESSSNVLSARELDVVARIVDLLIGPRHHASPTDWVAACQYAGYKDAKATASKLIRSDKLGQVISDRVHADTIRRESEAKQAEPVIVTVETAQSEVVDGGMRTYYSCGDVDVMALAKAVVAGQVHVLALSPNMPYLNTQAKALKELFPKSFPGCALARRDGTVAR